MRKLNLEKRNYKKITFVIVITLLLLAGLQYLVLKWGDQHTINIQQPISIRVQSPINIQPRFAVSPVPKAVYVEVGSMTTPAEIVEATKQGTVPSAGESNLTPISRDTIRNIIHNKVVQTWGESAWPAIDYLITHESNYQQFIVNKESGSCGIFQSLPCDKMKSMELVDQLNFGFAYIQNRYGSAQAAYQHELTFSWY
jgi:hypothetical protein